MKQLLSLIMRSLPCAALLTGIARADPDLRDGGAQHHLASADKVVSGQSFSFQYQVANSGSASDTKTVVTFWFSTDSVPGNAGDIKLPVQEIGEIGERSAETFTAVLPVPATGAVGTWNLVWEITANREADPRDNTAVYAKQFVISPPPSFDLVDAGAAFRTLSQTTLSPGESFQAAARVNNGGPAASTAFSVVWRLSTDTTIGDADDVQLGTTSLASLDAPGAPHAVTQAAATRTLTIPSGTAPGTYRFGYSITAPTDSNQGNNAVLFGPAITVPVPSGTVDLVDAGSGFWQGPYFPYVLHGDSVTVGSTLRNFGTAPSGTCSVVFFASTDDVAGDADDIVLPGGISVQSVAPNVNFLQLRSFEGGVQTSLLQAGTTYRLGWIITGGGDGNTSNNRTLSNIVIQVLPRPDIEIRPDWTVGGELVGYKNAVLQFSGTLRNNSDELRRVYLKVLFHKIRNNGTVETDKTFTGDLRFADSFNGGLIGNFSFAPHLQANSDRTITFTETARDISRTFVSFNVWTTRHIEAGNWRPTIEVFDRDTDALLASRHLAQVTLAEESRADLYVPTVNNTGDPLELSTTAVQPGGSITVRNIGIYNGGVADAPASTLRILANGTPIGSPINVQAIDRRSTGSDGFSLGDRTVTIPSNFPFGETVISVRVDAGNTINEESEANNVTQAGTITVGALPDLRDAGEEFQVIPDAMLPGLQTTLRVRIRNGGLANAGPFGVRFYLSPTEAVNTATAADLGVINVSSLAAVSSINLTFIASVPSGTSGTRYVAWKVDDGAAVIESVETNNLTVYGPVFIGSKANLKPGATPFAISSNEVETTGSFTITGSRRNSGSVTAGEHRVSFILKQGATQLRNIVTYPALAPGEDVPFSFVRTALNTPPGAYEVGMILDWWGQVEESDELDNAIWLPGLLHIVEPVVPEVPVPISIIEFVKVKSDVRLDWSSRKGFKYKLQQSSNGRSWRDFGSLIEGEPGQTGFWFRDAAGNEPTMFYRIAQE